MKAAWIFKNKSDRDEAYSSLLADDTLTRHQKYEILRDGDVELKSKGNIMPFELEYLSELFSSKGGVVIDQNLDDGPAASPAC